MGQMREVGQATRVCGGVGGAGWRGEKEGCKVVDAGPRERPNGPEWRHFVD
jgi:hypothetical protein